jgi:RNA polymerase sigma-70 factor, ECF subfamily
MVADGQKDSGARPPFTEVVDAQWTAVYRLLFSLGGHRQDAEDLAQETFLRALNRWSTFRPGSNLRAWLLRIASNAFLDLQRKRQRANCRALTAEPPGREAEPGERLEAQEKGELVRAALQGLSEKARLVFHLRVTEDLSFRDIADILETSEQAARWHMHDARSRLLKRLGEKM